MPDFVQPEISFLEKLKSVLRVSEIYFENIHHLEDEFKNKKQEFNSWSESTSDITILNWSGLTPFTGLKQEFLHEIKIFGKVFKPDDGQKDCIRYEEKSCFNPIFDEEKRLIGEYSGRLIAFHFDVFHKDNLVSRAVLVYGLMKAKLITEPEARRVLAPKKDSFLYRLLDAYNGRKEKRIIELVNNLNYYKKNISNYEKEIKNFNIKRKDDFIELCQWKSFKATNLPEMRRIIKKLGRFPFVKSVRLDTRQLRITFIDLILFKKNLASYVLTIDENLQDRVFNSFLKDKKFDDFIAVVQHPQIDANGKICKGNIRHIQDNLFSGHIDVFVQGIWELLNNHNPNDCGCSWEMFCSLFDWFKKHPKTRFPSKFYDHHGDYVSPEDIEKALKGNKDLAEFLEKAGYR